MFIRNDYAVSLDFILKDGEGNILDSSQEELMHYLHGRGILPPKLEAALTGKSCGEQVTIELSPEEAYGAHNPELVEQVGPEAFENGLQIYEGMIFQRETENGLQYSQVTKIEDNVITIDSNHPLAGKSLSWDVVVMAVRPATADELESGVAQAEAPRRGGCSRKNKPCTK